MKKIDKSLRSKQVLGLVKKFKDRIVSQDGAIEAVTNVLEKYLGGLNDQNRPIGSLLFLGPTGTGKTSLVEAMCEGLYGHSTAMVKIDCAEFQHSHEIAKLIGSPPGYLGHRETPPRLTNAALQSHHTTEVPFSIVLFDEIEKASDEVWHLALGILDKGKLTLGDNTVTDFKNTIIIMTSNVGSASMAEAAGDQGLGFKSSENLSLDKDLKDVAMSAARRKFTPEFLNRMDEIIVFNTLTESDIKKVLELEIIKAAVSLLSAHTIMLKVTPAAEKELLTRGFDKKYNGRNIRRTLEKEVLTPIARAISCGQISKLDSVIVDFKDEFVFHADPIYAGENESKANA